MTTEWKWTLQHKENPAREKKKGCRGKKTKKKDATGGAKPSADNNKGADENKKRIPPVVLNKADKWTLVSRRLQTNRIAYTKAKMTGKSVAIIPASTENHRRMTRLLTEEKRGTHLRGYPLFAIFFKVILSYTYN